MQLALQHYLARMYFKSFSGAAILEDHHNDQGHAYGPIFQDGQVALSALAPENEASSTVGFLLSCQILRSQTLRRMNILKLLEDQFGE